MVVCDCPGPCVLVCACLVCLCSSLLVCARVCSPQLVCARALLVCARVCFASVPRRGCVGAALELRRSCVGAASELRRSLGWPLLLLIIISIATRIPPGLRALGRVKDLTPRVGSLKI